MDFLSRREDYADLRSPSRAPNRHLTHLKKYNHFRRPGLSRADLPTDANQQAHYLPTCANYYCSNYETHDRCPMHIFPADLSTAPIAKFAKREAWDEAQRWPKAPSYHRSRKSGKEGSAKWERHTTSKKGLTKELNSREWWDDWMDEEMDDMCIEDLDAFERYCLFRENKDIYESEEDDLWYLSGLPPSDVDGHDDEGYSSSLDGDEHVEAHTEKGEVITEEEDADLGQIEWKWHRNFIGGWFRSSMECLYGYCECSYYAYMDGAMGAGWDELPPTDFSLADWVDGELEDEDARHEACINIVHERDKWSEDVWWLEKQSWENAVDADWDVLSVGHSECSEAWTDIDYVPDA